MSAIVTNNFKIRNAINFAKALSDSSTYFITIGKVDDWGTDSLTPTNTLQTYRSLWDNMIGGKIVDSTRVSLVIPRNNWTMNTIYSMYDDSDEELYNKNFFVMTSERNVYKCLNNNKEGPSTIEPTGTGTTPIETSDGYIWKYMYTLTLDELTKFDVDNYIPVTDNPSTDSNQYIIMRSAIEGTIDAIVVENGGLGYANPVVRIAGDGTGAEAEAVLNGTSIDKINIISQGQGYTYANVTIYDEGAEVTSECELRAIIAPGKGHGSDPVQELYANRVMVSTDLEYDEDGKLPITNDFRIITLLRDPEYTEYEDEGEGEEEHEHGVSVFSQLTQLQLNEGVSTYFDEDDIITGLTSGATARVVYITDTNLLYVTNVHGKFVDTETIQIKSNQAIIQKITPPDLVENSGEFVYIDYRRPISRAEDQKEKIRIILQF